MEQTSLPFASSVHAPERDSSRLTDFHGAEFHSETTPAERFRHSGWQRVRNLIGKSLFRTGQSTSRILNWQSCGYGAYILQSEQHPNTFKIAGSNCHDRFCTPCSRLRSQCIANAIVEHVGTKVVRFVTLTLKHSPQSLSEQIDRLYESFQRLRRSVWWKKRIFGGAAFLEVKRSQRSNEWHVHLHVLTTGKFLPQQELKSNWYKITGDSHIVDIRLARNRGDVIHYVSKYVTKMVSNSFVNVPDLLDEVVRALKGRKLCLTFGTWRGITLTSDPDSEGWVNLGSYNDWFARGLAGDAVAHRILMLLSPDLYEAERRRRATRSPPDSNGEASPRMTQLLLPPLPFAPIA